VAGLQVARGRARHAHPTATPGTLRRSADRKDEKVWLTGPPGAALRAARKPRPPTRPRFILAWCGPLSKCALSRPAARSKSWTRVRGPGTAGHRLPASGSQRRAVCRLTDAGLVMRARRRRAPSFDGTAPEPRPIPSGHIEGSVCVPIDELRTPDGRWVLRVRGTAWRPRVVA